MRVRHQEGEGAWHPPTLDVFVNRRRWRPTSRLPCGGEADMAVTLVWRPECCRLIQRGAGTSLAPIARSPVARSVASPRNGSSLSWWSGHGWRSAVAPLCRRRPSKHSPPMPAGRARWLVSSDAEREQAPRHHLQNGRRCCRSGLGKIEPERPSRPS